MPTTTTKPGIVIHEDTDTAYEPLYHTVLLDDDHHTYQYVVAMLAAVFGYAVNKGFAIACVVDSEGRAVVFTGSRDEARLNQDKIHAFGPDPLMAECKGSMSAVIEPVE